MCSPGSHMHDASKWKQVSFAKTTLVVHNHKKEMETNAFKLPNMQFSTAEKTQVTQQKWLISSTWKVTGTTLPGMLLIPLPWNEPGGKKIGKWREMPWAVTCSWRIHIKTTVGTQTEGILEELELHVQAAVPRCCKHPSSSRGLWWSLSLKQRGLSLCVAQ